MIAIRPSIRRWTRWTRGFAALASVAVILICAWFALMELVLRHPGYGWRVAVALAIAASAAFSFAVFEDLIEADPWRWPAAGGGAAAAALGWWVITEDLSRPGVPAAKHVEGYLLIAGLALIVHGVLTMVALLGARATS